MTKEEVAGYIDHTLLAADATHEQIKRLCQEAVQYGFASVCVNPCFVKFAHTCLAGSSVKVCTVIGFPFGAVSTRDKANETKNAVNSGADEVDMVINIGSAREGDFKSVEKDIAGVVKAARLYEKKHERKITVKVILETCLLSDSEIVECCKCSQNAGADFVKTSTGYATPKSIDGKALPNGASEHHVKLMKETVGNTMKVKASGGIRTQRMVISMLEAGADRIGTSSGVNILENWAD